MEIAFSNAIIAVIVAVSLFLVCDYFKQQDEAAAAAQQNDIAAAYDWEKHRKKVAASHKKRLGVEAEKRRAAARQKVRVAMAFFLV